MRQRGRTPIPRCLSASKFTAASTPLQVERQQVAAVGDQLDHQGLARQSQLRCTVLIWLAHGVAANRIRRAWQAEFVRQLALKVRFHSSLQLAHRRRNAHQAWVDEIFLSVHCLY